MAYLEDVIAAAKKTRGRTKNAEGAATILAAMAAQKAAVMQNATSAPLPGMPLRRGASPAARPAPAPAPTGGKHSMSDGHNHGSVAEVKGLNKEFESALNRLIADSGGRIKVTSGYRSPERQAQLYAAALKKYGSAAAARKWVAPPGRSNHGRGLAADISGDKKWARSVAHKYGLHFPLANEDWHIEPISARKKK